MQGCDAVPADLSDQRNEISIRADENGSAESSFMHFPHHPYCESDINALLFVSAHVGTTVGTHADFFTALRALGRVRFPALFVHPDLVALIQLAQIPKKCLLITTSCRIGVVGGEKVDSCEFNVIHV